MYSKEYYVYILTNNSGTLYIGVTNNLQRRVWEHQQGKIPGFTKKYNLKKLLYFEQTGDVNSAITREKELKGWTRQKKLDLIKTTNQDWQDLSIELGW